MNTLFAAVCAMFCITVATLADTVSLTPSADTTLFQSAPDNNLGGVPTLAVGTTGHGTAARALIKFDLTGQIPSNAVVTGVRLHMTIVRTPFLPQPSTFSLHRVLKDWSEGDKSASTLGELAAPGQTTWNNRFHPATPWQTPGAAAGVDFSAAVSSSSTNSDLGPSLFDTSSAIIADVRAWMADPGQNFGWIVISPSEGTSLTARRFGSREDTANSPVLEVEYAPPLL